MKKRQNQFITLNNNISNKGKGSRISFFENIFYWLWFYFNNIKNPGKPPSHAASISMTFLKGLNIVFLALIILSMLDEPILLIDKWMRIILCSYAIFFIADDWLYLKRFDKIKNKFAGLTINSIKKKKKTFFIYLAITIVTTATIPKLYSICMENKKTTTIEMSPDV